MIKLVRSLYDKKISGVGLSIFRIAYSLILLAEICQIYYFRHLIYDKIPYILPAEINFAIPLMFWGTSVLFLLLGAFTRTAALINYLLSAILIGSISSYEYHMFYAYMGMNFLLLFLPVSRNLSLDRLLTKLKYSNTRFNYNPPTTVSVLAYFVPLLIGVALVYFDSIFFKFASEFWRNGLGLWLPSSLPQATLLPIEFILNRKEVVIFLGYLTVAFEAVFIFTFFRKKWRVFLMFIGLGLHIGILICYPIPWFALGMCAIYLLMVPVSFWEKLFPSKGKENLTVYYDSECPLCNRTKIIVQHLDIGKRVSFKTVQFSAADEPLLKEISYESLLDNIHSVKEGRVFCGIDTYVQVFHSILYLRPLSWLLRIPGIYQLGTFIYGIVAKNRTTERCTEDNCGFVPPALPLDESKFKILKNYTLSDLKIFAITLGLGALIATQVVVSYNSLLIKDIRTAIGFQNTSTNRFLESISAKLGKQSKIYLGITNHGVFMDYHFSEYNHIIAISYVTDDGHEEWLPIIDKDGTPGNYLYGFNWSKWSFRVNHNIINQINLERGIRDFTAFWAYKNGVDLNNAVFKIKLKKVDTPKEWKKNFLKRQMNKPWQNIGTATWKDKNYSIDIPIVEQL